MEVSFCCCLGMWLQNMIVLLFHLFLSLLFIPMLNMISELLDVIFKFICFHGGSGCDRMFWCQEEWHHGLMDLFYLLSLLNIMNLFYSQLVCTVSLSIHSIFQIHNLLCMLGCCLGCKPCYPTQTDGKCMPQLGITV